MRGMQARNPRALVRALAIVAAGAALAGCTVTRSDSPDLAGRDVRFTVFHTSDIHSRIFPYQAVVSRFDRDLGLDPDQCGCNIKRLGGKEGSGKPLCCNNAGEPQNNLSSCDDPIPQGWYKAHQCNIGGIARMKTILDRERARAGSRQLYLDSGDIFQGGPVFNVFQGEAEVRAMARMGLDAMVFGNHEIDRGATNLYLQMKRYGTFGFLAANYQFDPPSDPTRPKLGDLVKPFMIYNLDGLKVAVIGMGNQSSLNSLVEGGNSLGMRPLETRWVIKNYLAALRPMVDLIILVSHMGLEEDEGVAASEVKDAEAEELENIADGVDIILGGHLHIVLHPPKVINDPALRPSGRPTVILHPGAFAKFVTRLDLVVHKKGPDDPPDAPGSNIKAFDSQVFAVDESVPSDPGMEQMLAPYELELNRRIDLTRKFAFIPGDDNTRVLRTDATGGDSQLGNLVAASMRFRERVEADFAVTNSLGIRADFNSGPLDLEQMFNVFPFENSITVMYLSGNEVKEMLDFIAFRSTERGCRTQAQVSGLWFDMVCNAQPAHAENVWIGDHCAPCRPTDHPGYEPGECRCRQLDPVQSYRAAVNDYIAAGGSGFTVLKRNTTKQNTGIPLRDALVDYISRKIELCPSTCKNIDGQPMDAFSCLVAPGGACGTEVLETVEAHDGRIFPIQ